MRVLHSIQKKLGFLDLDAGRSTLEKWEAKTVVEKVQHGRGRKREPQNGQCALEHDVFAREIKNQKKIILIKQ